MQPTHARWEQISAKAPSSRVSQSGADRIDDALHDGPNGVGGHSNGREAVTDTIFPDIPPVFTRNFMISDTYYETPPASVLGYPGPDEEVLDVGPGELSGVREQLLADLPEDCRSAFIEARAVEKAWKARWSTEKEDGARAQLRITYNT